MQLSKQPGLAEVLGAGEKFAEAIPLENKTTAAAIMTLRMAIPQIERWSTD